MSRAKGLRVFRHLWGIDPQGNREKSSHLIRELKALGYSGVEASLSAIHEHGGDDFLAELKSQNMDLIVGIYSGWTDYIPNTWTDKSVQDHLKQFEDEINQAHNLSLQPIMLNAHAGCDHWSDRECYDFFNAAGKFNADIPIAHETHRGRVLWNPWRTLQLIQEFPSLKLTLDFSHWVVGAERLLDSEWDHKWIDRILPHVIHIHGRIGTDEAPQIIDPRDPQSKEYVERFDRLWSKVWKTQFESDILSTLTPEYGPSPYTPMAPFTGAPLSDVWDVCNNECSRQQQRYKTQFKI